MAQARKGSRVQSKINLIAYGAPFSGKSTLGLQMAKLKNPDGSPFKLLILDCENGSVDEYLDDLENEGVALDNIYIVYTQSLEEVNKYIKAVTEKQDMYVLDDDGEETEEVVTDAEGKPFRADAILLDGTSILKMTCQQSLLNLSRKRAKVRANKNGLTGEEKAVAVDGASLEMKDWGTLSYSGQSLILNLAASGVHWVVTAREKAETERHKNAKGEIETINTGKFIPDGFNGSDYNAKTVVRMFRDEDDPDVVKMRVDKDRTGIFAPGQIVEDPSILDFQELINKKGTGFIPKNSMEQAIEIESKMYQKQAGILDEDEEAPFDTSSQQSATPSVSADDLKKQIKAYRDKMGVPQRKALGERLKAEDIPTSLSKIDDTTILSRIVAICKEIVEAE